MSGEPIQIRTMRREDIPFADSLRQMAGWNQLPADWERFLRMEPNGCFLAEWQNSPAGTATTVTYDHKVAWIGMVLVHPDHRRKGIGRALLLKCIEHLKRIGIPSIKLDATPEGQKVYEKLGFISEWNLSRWEWRPDTNEHPVPPAAERPSVLNATELNAIAQLDQCSFGVSRGPLLREIARQSYAVATACSRMESPAGFGFIRPGANALQIGPVGAESVESFRRVIKTLTREFLSQGTYRIYWDIPDQNLAAINWAQQEGFKIQRTLTRMYLGSNPHTGKPDRYFAVASPDLG